jgi:hypothetical protein
VSSQAASRVARDRLGARSRAQAASGLTGSMRVSELAAEEDTPRRPRAMHQNNARQAQGKKLRGPRVLSTSSASFSA